MRIANLDDWRTDPMALSKGVPLDLGENRRLIVRRTGTRNREFMAAMVGIETSDETSVMQAYARTVVVGWEGFNDESGEPVPFSPEECVELFVACPELFDRVTIFAAQRGNYRAQQLDEAKAQVKRRPGGTNAQARTASN